MTDMPLNPLETVMYDGVAGLATPADLHAAVLKSTLYVPTLTQVIHDMSELTPIMLPTPRSDLGMVVAFTDLSRVTPEAKAHTPYCLHIIGSALALTLATNAGLLIMAGPGVAAEIDPPTLQEMRESLLEE